MKLDRKFYLASKSPRRAEILSMVGIEFETVVKDTDESGIVLTTPDEYVKQLALRKLNAVIGDGEYRDCYVLAADTIVWCAGEVFGKPHDRADAYRMIKAMSGSTHQVYTGVALYDGEKTDVRAVAADVCFKELSDEEIYYYIDNYKVTDKAGAYGIQEYASVFVKEISGDYFNIVGLPISTVYDMINHR